MGKTSWSVCKAALSLCKAYFLFGEASLPSGRVSFLFGEASSPIGRVTFLFGRASRPIGKASFPLGRTMFVSFRASRIEVEAAFDRRNTASGRAKDTVRRVGAAFAEQDNVLKDDVVASHLVNREGRNSVSRRMTNLAKAGLHPHPTGARSRPEVG